MVPRADLLRRVHVPRRGANWTSRGGSGSGRPDHLGGSSDRQDQADHEGGEGQNESPDGQHSKRRSADRTAGHRAESSPPANLHSQHPDDGSDGDEDQRDD
jgi:hypothetical protein